MADSPRPFFITSTGSACVAPAGTLGIPAAVISTRTTLCPVAGLRFQLPWYPMNACPSIEAGKAPAPEPEPARQLTAEALSLARM